MSKLRTIAIFSPSLQFGGAERVVANLANGFSRQGIHVSLLLASKGPLLIKIDPSVKVVDFEKSGVFGAIIPLVKYLRNERPDILFSAQSHANIVALLARKMAHTTIPIVISEHTTMSVHFALEPGLKNRFVPRLARFFYHQADAVVCVSQGVAGDILDVTLTSPERVHCIYNPVLPLEAELEQKIEAPVDHPWFLPDAPSVLLAVGRLTAAKDYPTLLRAFARVRQDRNVNLLILGEGEKRIELENLVKKLGLVDNVHMPGFVDNPYAYIARSSIFLLSSAWEGFSNVLVEALACGVPIIATDCKYGPAEILENGRFGKLVQVGDYAAMADAILEALDTDPDRGHLRQRSLDFTHETAIEQYYALFNELLGLNRR